MSEGSSMLTALLTESVHICVCVCKTGGQLNSVNLSAPSLVCWTHGHVPAICTMQAHKCIFIPCVHAEMHVVCHKHTSHACAKTCKYKHDFTCSCNDTYIGELHKSRWRTRLHFFISLFIPFFIYFSFILVKGCDFSTLVHLWKCAGLQMCHYVQSWSSSLFNLKTWYFLRWLRERRRYFHWPTYLWRFTNLLLLSTTSQQM